MDGSGDGWKICSDGAERWGLNGAAGVLFCSELEGESRFFLVHRSPEVDQGDNWGIPGGAVDGDESSLEAAWRETLEELGRFDEPAHVVRGSYVARPAEDWSYETFVIELEQPFEVDLDDVWEGDAGWETMNAAWLTRAEVDELELHPGFRALWDSGQLDALLPGRPPLSDLTESSSVPAAVESAGLEVGTALEHS
jgi:8-oxo-dGTP pyrophosphatase MutT (NUDIX family)